MSESERTAVALAPSFIAVHGGARLRYVTGGSGPPVVLIHGSVVTLEEMVLGLFDALAQRFTVIAFDRPGHGRSERGRFQSSPWIQARTIHDAVAALGIERPILVGHSYGGAVALAYAMLFPQSVERVVAIAPIAFPEPRLEQGLFGLRAVPFAGDALAYTLGPLIDRVVLPVLWEMMFKPQQMPKRFREAFPFALVRRPGAMQAEGEDAASLWGALTVAAAAYPTCRVPVKILAGTSDVVVRPERNAKPLAGMLPNAELRMFEGLGHMLHHFVPEAVVDACL